MGTLLATHASATDELCSTLLFAATDTTSGALSRTVHLLAEHPEVQQKLREEIIAAKGTRDQIPYDELSALPYLDAVCRETLRLYVHLCCFVSPNPV